MHHPFTLSGAGNDPPPLKQLDTDRCRRKRGRNLITNQKFRARAKLSGGAAPVVLALAMITAPAFAQTAQSTSSDLTNQENTTSSVPTGSATGAGPNDNGEIVVTGSRIARRDLTSAAPLSVVSDEEFKLSGSINVEQVLNTLPQVIPGSTSFSNNPGGGVATLNLRGLGTQRNLVLVNGRRYVFFDTSQVVDLNTIPQFLIDSVDVVTGGASAVYGSDAIAGVTNFRLREDLVGLEGGGQYSITEDGDGARYNAHLAIGTKFADGKGHLTAYAEYYNRKAIFQGARGFSARTAVDGDNGLTFNGGSATTPSGRFAVPGTATIGTGATALTLNRGAGTAFGTALGATFDSAASGARPFVQGPDTYNFAPVNYLQVPQERYLLGAFGNYEISSAATAYMEVAFINNRVANELAATPVTGNFNVNIDAVSPFLTAGDIAALRQIDANETAINAARAARGLGPLFTTAAAPSNAAGVVQLGVNRRILETGGRNSLDERNAFRILTGLKGDITPDLHYDAYYSYARTRNANVQAGNISRSAFQRGLDGTDPAIDIFGPNSLSPTSTQQVSILAQNNDISVLQVAQAAVNGELFDFGLGGGKVGFAAGAEYRKLFSRFIPDTALSSGDVIGFNAGNPTEGQYNVKEVFGELNIPIVADKPFFSLLELNGAGRYSDYSLDAVGGQTTYAAGIKWAPIRDITFRGQYSRAVRAPNVGELFGGLQQGFPQATDPCAPASAAANATLRALCIATGVPAAQVGAGAALQPNTQLQSQSGGNPNLTAEKSTSYTFGAVVRPSFIPGLSITADYFHIKIGNAIATAGGGAANILNLCYNVFQNASNGFCQLITRNSSNGQIDGAPTADGTAAVIFAGAANLSSLKTSGIDLQADYTTRVGFGLLGEESKLNLSFLGTWTESNVFRPVNGISDSDVECAGFFGANCGNPQAKYKWTSRASFIDGPLTSTVRWRHIGRTRDDDNTSDYTIENLKAYNLFDLAFSLDITDQYSLSAGVNNLLNKRPPIIGGNAEQANTYPGTFDVLGRDFFVSANFRF
jgi:iron complex outermembrane receptor protein